MFAYAVGLIVDECRRLTIYRKRVTGVNYSSRYIFPLTTALLRLLYGQRSVYDLGFRYAFVVHVARERIEPLCASPKRRRFVQTRFSSGKKKIAAKPVCTGVRLLR